jgi:ssRNA-specific RNase YbeY (16S rRNA maturation enzyme)
MKKFVRLNLKNPILKNHLERLFQISLKLGCVSNDKIPWSLQVEFINSHQIQSLNSQYRFINKPTDILSFPLQTVCYILKYILLVTNVKR